MIFCEAAAFGLPALSTRTGGIPSIIREGSSGHLLPVEAGGDEFARLITDIFTEPGRYEALCAGARKTYEERLNWDAWAKDWVRIARGLGLLSREKKGIIHDGIDGCVFDPFDHDGFVDAMRRMAHEPGYLNQMKNAAKTRARDYTWEKVAGLRRENLMRLYSTQQSR